MGNNDNRFKILVPAVYDLADYKDHRWKNATELPFPNKKKLLASGKLIKYNWAILKFQFSIPGPRF